MAEISEGPQETGEEFIVHCSRCNYAWVAAFLPMTIDKFVKVSRNAICPHGCDAPVLCGGGRKAA